MIWLALLACGGGEVEGEIPKDATAVVVGDSFLAWNRKEGASVAQLLDERLDASVGDAAVSGAVFTSVGAEPDIRDQVPDDRTWDWVVFDGGGNDLNDECSCSGCADVLDDLIAEDGTGAIPAFVDQLNGQGTKVVMFSYPNLPPTASFGFADCSAVFDAYRTRLLASDDTRPEFWVVDGRQVIDRDDLSFFDDDHVHPSIKGSEAVADAVAEVIQ